MITDPGSTSGGRAGPRPVTAGTVASRSDSQMDIADTNHCVTTIYEGPVPAIC